MLKSFYATAKEIITSPTTTTKKIESLSFLAKSYAAVKPKDSAEAKETKTSLALLLADVEEDLLFAALNSPNVTALTHHDLDDGDPSIDKTVPQDIERQRMAKWLINNGANINARLAVGATLLTATVARGDWCMVRFLIRAGVDVNTSDFRNSSILMQLFEAPGSIQDKIAMFFVLCEAGAKITNPNALLFTLLKQGDAVLPIIEILFEQEPKADINARNDNATPLMVAVQQDASRVVSFLLRDAKLDLDLLDHDGESAMSHAMARCLKNSNATIFEMLLPYYRNRSINRKQQTPLMYLLEYIAEKVDDSVATTLINRCFDEELDLNLVDLHKDSIWMYAASLDSPTMLERLVAAQPRDPKPPIDLTTHNGSGFSPLYRAMAKRKDKTAIYIIEHLHEQKQTHAIESLVSEAIAHDHGVVVEALVQHGYIKDIDDLFKKVLVERRRSIAVFLIEHPQLDLIKAAELVFLYRNMFWITLLGQIIIRRLKEKPRLTIAPAASAIFKIASRDELLDALQYETQENVLLIMEYICLRGQSNRLNNPKYLEVAWQRELSAVVRKLAEEYKISREWGSFTPLTKAFSQRTCRGDVDEKMYEAIIESVPAFLDYEFIALIHHIYLSRRHSSVLQCLFLILRRFSSFLTSEHVHDYLMDLLFIIRTGRYNSSYDVNGHGRYLPEVPINLDSHIPLIKQLLSLRAMQGQQIKNKDPRSQKLMEIVIQHIEDHSWPELIQVFIPHATVDMMIALVKELLQNDCASYEGYIKQILAQTTFTLTELKDIQTRLEEMPPFIERLATKRQMLLQLQLALNNAQLRQFCAKQMAEQKASSSSSSTDAMRLRLYKAIQDNDAPTFLAEMSKLTPADIAKLDGKLLGTALSFWMTNELLQGKPLASLAETKTEEKSSSTSTTSAPAKIVNIDTFLAAIEEAKAWDAYVPCDPYSSKSGAVRFMQPLHLAFFKSKPNMVLIHRLLKHVPHSQWIAQDASGRTPLDCGSTAIQTESSILAYAKQAQLEDYALYAKTRTTEGPADKDCQNRSTILRAFHTAEDGRAIVTIAEKGAAALSKTLSSNRAGNILTKISHYFPSVDNDGYRTIKLAHEEFNRNRLQVILEEPGRSIAQSPTTTAPRATLLSGVPSVSGQKRAPTTNDIELLSLGK